MAHILWRVVFGVSPSVGVKGNSREEGAKKRIFTADGEEEGNLLYTTIHLFLFFPHPLRAFLLPENDTDKKGKCTEGKEDGNNGSLLGMCQIKVWGSHEIIGSIFLSFFLSTVQAHTRKRCGKNV